MNPLHFTIVVMQVIAFQLLWTRLNRRLPDLLVGVREVPAGIAAELDLFRERSGRGRIVLGILYLLIVVAATFALPLDPHQRKLALGVVSLLSSATLVIGFFRDIIRIRRISASLPDPAVRVAGLRPRSLSMAYPPILEAIPILLIVATFAGTIWAIGQGFGFGGLHAWLRPVVQVLYFAFTFGMTIFQIRTGSCLTWRARSLQATPEATLALTEKLIRMEARYLFYCRIAMALLLGVMQVRAIRTDMGLPGGDVLKFVEWIILMTILAQLILYLHRHPIRANRSSASISATRPENGGVQ
jgi:hypothetical protein